MLMYDYMQKVVLKNLSDIPLVDLSLTHTGEGGSPIKIKKIEPHSHQVANIYTLRAKKNCDLILNYSLNNKIKSKVVYKNLSSDDLRTLVLELTVIDDELQVNTLVGNELFY